MKLPDLPETLLAVLGDNAELEASIKGYARACVELDRAKRAAAAPAGQQWVPIPGAVWEYNGVSLIRRGSEDERCKTRGSERLYRHAPPTSPPPSAEGCEVNIKAEIESGRAIIRCLPYVTEFALIGSALYLEDAGDVDFAVMLEPGQQAMDYAAALSDDGWGVCGEYDSASGTWCAIRRENLNLMLTHDRSFYDGYKRAMEVCKALRLTSKADRIVVCQIVRDGKTADEVRPHFAPIDLAAYLPPAAGAA